MLSFYKLLQAFTRLPRGPGKEDDRCNFFACNFFCMVVWFGEGYPAGQVRRTTTVAIFFACIFFCMVVWFGEGCPAGQVRTTTTVAFFVCMHFFLQGGVVWGGLPREPKDH